MRLLVETKGRDYLRSLFLLFLSSEIKVMFVVEIDMIWNDHVNPQRHGHIAGETHFQEITDTYA